MKPGCRRLGTLAAFAALLATTISAGPTAATVSPVTMDITIGYDCVEGDKGFLPSVTLTLKHADGSVIDTGNDSNPSPNFAVCFSHQVHIGDKVLADWGGGHRQVTIPDLTIGADRITDVVSGHGPAGANLVIAYAPCSLSGCGGYQLSHRTVDRHGRYAKDLSSDIDFKGADRLEARYNDPQGDAIRTDAHVAYLQLSKPNDVHIECQPDRAVNVTLRTSNGSLRATRTFPKGSACGTPDGTFRAHGAAVDFAVGNIIRSDLASDAKVVWPHVGVSATDGSPGLKVRCLPSSPIGVDVSWAPNNHFGYYATTGSDGRLDVLNSGHTFHSGDQLALTCSTLKGDRIAFTSSVP